MYVCMHACMYLYMYVCIYICTYVRMYVCMYVRTHVRKYVCMYVCMFVYIYVEIKYQLDATEVFIADIIACSTCFGHHYAHHHELKSIIQWLLPVVFRAVVFTGHITLSSTPDQQI